MSARPERTNDEELKQQISDLLHQTPKGTALLVIASYNPDGEDKIDLIGNASHICDLFVAARAILEAIRQYTKAHPPLPTELAVEALARCTAADLILMGTSLSLAVVDDPAAPKPTAN